MDVNAATPQRNRKRRWFQFSLRTLFLLVTIVAAWLGWRNYLASVRLADEADAREAVFREIFRDSSDQDGDSGFGRMPIFISFGEADRLWEFLDPPAGYLVRFRDLKLNIKLASAARAPRPKSDPGSESTEDLVHDAVTGEEGWIVSASVIRWTDGRTIELSVVEFGGILVGKGYRATVQLKNGKWEVISQSHEWNS